MFGFRFLNDRTLIQLIRTGNEEALILLYARTFKKVYRYVLSKRARVKDAEEVITEALLTVWQQVIRQKNGQNLALAHYVLAVARNHWNKKSRRKEKKNVSHETGEEAISMIELNEWWPRLSETDRKLLGYFYFDGFSVKEIAELTGMQSADAVRQRKSELLRWLIEKNALQK